MDLKSFAEVLAHFPKSPQTARTATQIAEDWPLGSTDPAKLKKVYRCIRELCPRFDDDDGEDYGAEDMRDFVRKLAPAEGADTKSSRVYLDMNAVADFFMTDAVALQLLLGRGAINHALLSDPALQSGDVERLARRNLRKAKGDVGALAGKVRVVADGPPRQPARIDPEVLRCVILALIKRRKLTFDYRSSADHRSTKTVGPLGLVAKDGALYLIGREGTRSEPGSALPLHRMLNPKLSLTTFDPSRFDIDAYLERTGQLSHPQGDPDATILLELKVHPIAIWHFQERPIGGGEQVITEPSKPGGWYGVSLPSKFYYQWRPFLASFGPNVEVVGPPELRDGPEGLGSWARAMAALYPAPSAPATCTVSSNAPSGKG
jgi:predicted DNA-binding transcriptional regulator YafY